jgi:coenzyme F420 biosynthesis associated uncharacterized protein
MARRTRIAALVTLAMINVFTLAAGIAVARMLPPRLAALRVPTVAPGQAVAGDAVLGAGIPDGPPPSPNGLRNALAGPMSAAALGPQVSALVADPVTGRVLLSEHGGRLMTPASTTKLATGLAALAILGDGARFTTRVVRGAAPDSIILVGGGDPTLAVNPFPARDYPQPATLASLAAATARKLRAQGHRTVVLGYDTSLYTGPGLAPGWPADYVSGGDVTPIVSLEVDQGRLNAAGQPEDSDDPYNLQPRSDDPAGMAAGAFSGLLTADGIHVTGTPTPQTAPARAGAIASVTSPALSAIVAQMLEESNNVIAENLARQVALATGEPASFSGAAQAVISELKRLGVTTGIHLVDGSGLSPQDAIAPATLVKVLELAASRPRLRALLAGLPVAGFSGTLSAGESVFSGISGAALGSVRAKTGNLGTVASLAGLVYDKSGGVLVFAFMADQIPSAGLLQPAANAIDAAASALAGCGCRLRVPVTGAAGSTYGWTVSSTQMIDWDLAISTGTRWARPGPQVSLAEARRTVTELRDLAGAVQQPVHEVTGMSAAADGTMGRVAIVDRPGWIRANVDGFRVVLEPLVDQLRERNPGADSQSRSGSVISSVGSRVTGIQAGLILAYLSGRVLGQYELFLPPETSPVDGQQPGRLTLVAPNIVMIERELGVDPHDFRRWVCLHEETHRLQFTAVPWLRDYVQREMTEFLLASELDPAAMLQRVRAAADAMAGAVRGGDGGSLIEAVATPAQREIMDRLTSVMTLVEGHGDYVMDAVGPQVVPTVAEIREKFNARRGSSGRIEQALRRMLGIDLKMKQYAEGSRFVRTVVDKVGMATFNKVWTSPDTLPTKAEFANPQLWLDRVADSSSSRPTDPD